MQHYVSIVYIVIRHQYSYLFIHRTIIPPAMLTKGPFIFINDYFNITWDILLFRSLFSYFKNFNIYYLILSSISNWLILLTMSGLNSSTIAHMATTSDSWFSTTNLTKFWRLACCIHNAANKMVNLTLYSKEGVRASHCNLMAAKAGHLKSIVVISYAWQ